MFLLLFLPTNSTLDKFLTKPMNKLHSHVCLHRHVLLLLFCLHGHLKFPPSADRNGHKVDLALDHCVEEGDKEITVTTRSAVTQANTGNKPQQQATQQKNFKIFVERLCVRDQSHTSHHCLAAAQPKAAHTINVKMCSKSCGMEHCCIYCSAGTGHNTTADCS